MAPRVRVALLVITALVLMPRVLGGSAVVTGAVPATAAVAENEAAPAIAAVALRAPGPVVPRGLPQAVLLVAAVVAVRFSGRRRSLRGLPFLLGDVGDGWRARLFGAPPSLL